MKTIFEEFFGIEKSLERISIEFDLEKALWQTRQEPGLPLHSIAKIIKKELKAEEVDVLIKELSKKDESNTEQRKKSEDGKATNTGNGTAKPCHCNITCRWTINRGGRPDNED